MILNLGDFKADETVYVPFATYDSNGASVTMTGLAVTDIEIYKDGSTTQRSSDAGYALLDTDGIDFDSVTGLHGFSIDLSDNTDSGFFASGSDYWVVVSTITVDSQTVSFIAAVFSIENRSAERVYSDTTLIHSQTTVIESDSIVIESNTAKIESKVVEIESDTTAINSDTTAIHSDTAAIHSQTTVIESDTAVIE